MRNKTKRLISIKQMIEEHRISSQEELLKKLKDVGIEATQSTLSRDLKTLKVGKIPDEERGYIYVVPSKIPNSQKEEKVAGHVTDAIISIEFSNNIAVLKTLSGYANAVTALIDNENYFEILGTIAGDDTIIIIMRESITRMELINALSSIYSDIHKLYK
ncbi:MAG: arginine repressor [Marinifilaceae bacterium]|jgi:transcriptional regulator of arginine metabolism|nr:arginine repressor [Marinifilaceae bacterium]